MRLFLSYFRPHRKLFAADLFCAAFIAGVDLLFPVLTRYSINALLPEGSFRIFFMLIGFLIILYLIRTAASYFVTFFGHLFGARVEADMRRDIFNHVEKQSFRFFDRHRTGQIMSRITNDLFEITELAHHGPEDLFISVITLTGSFIIMLTIRWELALVMLFFLPVMILHTTVSRGRLTKSSRKVKERIAEINTTIESSISGARVTKAFTNEMYENSRFAESNREFYGAKRQFYRAMAFFHSRLEFITNMLSVAVLAAGGYLIMRSEMNLADLITANLFVAAFLQPVRRLASFVEQYTTGMAGFSRFREIMETDEKTPEKPNAVLLKSIHGDIVYKNVCFSYNNLIPVLKNVNLSIKAGQMVALVGPSGGGKTTLCSLLPRFYELGGGNITIDGFDVCNVTLESLRRNIGLVQQDVFLFAGTIRDNIAYGRIGATDSDIMEAAKRAQMHDDIIKMPDGYDTIVGERGIKLSGGQKQRISIARIFLKNPPVLILDEATSALDTATEVKIQQSFEELAKGRTTLVIAHRLSTIKNADVIVVVDDEGIAESGTHAELFAKDGLYANLYKAQHGLTDWDVQVNA